jgi:predicted Zn-dependent protease
VINDPEMVNAFAVPGGRWRHTADLRSGAGRGGLAVLGHEVPMRWRHPAEHEPSAQLAAGLGVALGKNPAMANQVLQAYGIVSGVGVALPFSRSQETEADRIGLILMAKAGYDPRVAIDLWQRMESLEKKDGAQGRPPEFLSTHPGYETRLQNIRSFLPEALSYYRPRYARLEPLPSAESLDTPAAKSERS